MILRQIEAATQCSSFEVCCTEDNPSHSSLNQCTGTHGARFQGHQKCALVESPVIFQPRGLPESDQLGMTQWISGRFTAIASVTDAAALFIENHSCHRNFAVASSFSCAFNQHLHPTQPQLFVQDPLELFLVNHP